jgi:histidine triad (HIT) family protein
MAFLDARPLFAGHCLVITKKHCETFEDVPVPMLGPLFSLVQTLTRAVREVMNAEGTFVAMNNTVSQSVPHVHVHVVPRRRGDGLRGFFWPRQHVGEEEMNRVQQALVARLAELTLSR